MTSGLFPNLSILLIYFIPQTLGHWICDPLEMHWYKYEVFFMNTSVRHLVVKVYSKYWSLINLQYYRSVCNTIYCGCRVKLYDRNKSHWYKAVYTLENYMYLTISDVKIKAKEKKKYITMWMQSSRSNKRDKPSVINEKK